MKALAFENLWKPELVVLPHLVIGHLVGLHPHGDGFVGLGQLSLVEITGKDSAVNAQAVGKLEVELALVFEICWREPNLFLSLTDSGFLNGLAFVDLATRTIDLSFTETTFLAYEEDLVLTPYKYQHRPHLGGPFVPIDVDSWLVRHALPLRTNRFRRKHKPESQVSTMIKFSLSKYDHAETSLGLH